MGKGKVVWKGKFLETFFLLKALSPCLHSEEDGSACATVENVLFVLIVNSSIKTIFLFSILTTSPSNNQSLAFWG